MSLEGVLKEITTERQEQDRAWGGPDHDDTHTEQEWAYILSRHLGLACGDSDEVDPARFRRQMIRLAAVAVAAVESLDRKAPSGEPVAVPDKPVHPYHSYGKGF